jgi:UDP-N-acetylglucosamine:LPS N-acetylglucosamine transferase
VGNARHAEGAGAARRLAERDATPERLATLLVELLADGAVLADMGARARRLARADAAAAIADRAAALAGGSPGGPRR